jgi:hypothetical protein
VELAVAAAIALFGFQSGAALATVVGVLVEVPVMLSVMRIVLRTRVWYEEGRWPRIDGRLDRVEDRVRRRSSMWDRQLYNRLFEIPCRWATTET